MPIKKSRWVFFPFNVKLKAVPRTRAAAIIWDVFAVSHCCKSQCSSSVPWLWAWCCILFSNAWIEQMQHIINIYFIVFFFMKTLPLSVYFSWFIEVTHDILMLVRSWRFMTCGQTLTSAQKFVKHATCMVTGTESVHAYPKYSFKNHKWFHIQLFRWL